MPLSDGVPEQLIPHDDWIEHDFVRQRVKRLKRALEREHPLVHRANLTDNRN
jgi:hypothetical protein